MKISVFNKSTGEIARWVVVPEHLADLQLPNENFDWVENDVENPFDYYIVDGAVTPRPEFPCSVDKETILADGEDKAVISGVPAGTEIQVGGRKRTADGSDIEFITDTVGSHTLAFSLFPYLDKELTIHAT